MEDLPMMPDQFKLEVIKQTGKQFSAVKAQLQRKDTGGDHYRHRCRPGGRTGGQADPGEGGCRKPIKLTLDFLCHGQSDKGRICEAEKRA